MNSREEKPLLEIMGINKSFGDLKILKSCSLNVHSRETMVIIGPSGSGKSTLLRCINLLEPADDGNIFFEGDDIARNCVRLRKSAARSAWCSRISNFSNI